MNKEWMSIANTAVGLHFGGEIGTNVACAKLELLINNIAVCEF